jgi:F-type H+-transporting ATPase subunit delta
MALRRSTARRYAEAAYEIALRDDTVETWLEAFAVAEERLAAPEVARLLRSPAVPVTARLELLDKIVDDAVTGSPRNLIALLIRRGRFDELGAVAREFRRLDARRRGIVEALVSAALPLDDADRAAMDQQMTAMTGKDVRMEEQVDPALLGGVQVRVGDRLIDGSIRGRLERLRATLSTTS